MKKSVPSFSSQLSDIPNYEYVTKIIYIIYIFCHITCEFTFSLIYDDEVYSTYENVLAEKNPLVLMKRNCATFFSLMHS